MKRLLSVFCGFEDSLALATELDDTPYTAPVIFHTFWKGRLNKKHVYSLASCLRHHKRSNYSVILWVPGESMGSNDLIHQELTSLGISIRGFDCASEMERSGLSGIAEYRQDVVTFYSDFVRSLLLYNYGGCWFDLDFFFLRSFDPLFSTFGSEICVYEWETQPYPNNAIYFSLEPRSKKMESNMRFIQGLNRGWGFQQAGLTYDLDLDLLVLPCSWFDPDWIPNPYSFGVGSFFKAYTGPRPIRFFEGCFGYHWHNRWDEPIEPDCVADQLLDLPDFEEIGFAR